MSLSKALILSPPGQKLGHPSISHDLVESTWLWVSVVWDSDKSHNCISRPERQRAGDRHLPSAESPWPIRTSAAKVDVGRKTRSRNVTSHRMGDIPPSYVRSPGVISGAWPWQSERLCLASHTGKSCCPCSRLGSQPVRCRLWGAGWGLTIKDSGPPTCHGPSPTCFLVLPSFPLPLSAVSCRGPLWLWPP